MVCPYGPKTQWLILRTVVVIPKKRHMPRLIWYLSINYGLHARSWEMNVKEKEKLMMNMGEHGLCYMDSGKADYESDSKNPWFSAWIYSGPTTIHHRSYTSKEDCIEQLWDKVKTSLWAKIEGRW